MVSIGAALRGEVWMCALPRPVGPHPVVILTVNRIAVPLSAVTVAVVTGSAGPPVTHVAVGADSGLTKYAEFYVNVTDLHTVGKLQLRRRLGILSAGELHSVETGIRTVLGLS